MTTRLRDYRTTRLRDYSTTRLESGQAAVETAMILMLLVIIAGGILAVGPVLYAHVVVLNAANDCATAAAQTLNAEQGHFQGMAAARESLRGARVRRGGASVVVSGTWERGSPVTCTVDYTLDMGGVPLLASFGVDPSISYSVSLPAQAYKSVWR